MANDPLGGGGRDSYGRPERLLRKPTVYRFEPVGLDLWDRRAHTPARGILVVKTSGGRGTPPNGTMGHCFVADAATGAFIGLVLVNSLVKA